MSKPHDTPRTTNRHIEPLVAFAKEAYWLREQIEAADQQEDGALDALLRIMPSKALCAWYAASAEHSTWAAHRGADTVIHWFLRPGDFTE